jgi:hypothetical protein
LGERHHSTGFANIGGQTKEPAVIGRAHVVNRNCQADFASSPADALRPPQPQIRSEAEAEEELPRPRIHSGVEAEEGLPRPRIHSGVGAVVGLPRPQNHSGVGAVVGLPRPQNHSGVGAVAGLPRPQIRSGVEAVAGLPQQSMISKRIVQRLTAATPPPRIPDP